MFFENWRYSSFKNGNIKTQYFIPSRKIKLWHILAKFRTAPPKKKKKRRLVGWVQGGVELTVGYGDREWTVKM
jgi:hypothetical protein